MDQKETLQIAPKDLKEKLEIIIKQHTFKKWDADSKWNKSPRKILLILCDLSDVNAVSKITGTAKKTMSNRKIVDIDLGYKLRFRETRKKSGGRAPNAKTTAMQEAASAAVFELALKKKSGWITEEKFATDDAVEKAIREVYSDAYDDPENDWITVFWKQHKTILDKLSNSQINKFNHTGGFMDYISDVVAKIFKIPKKDNWNPADIWGVKGNSNSAIAKVKETVKGTPESQTIQQLNALLRGMYKNKELVGISLKKTSGRVAKWEEYNIDALTLSEVDDYKYKDIKIIMNFKPTGGSKSLDTAVQLRQSGGGPEYNFQVTSNDTSKPDQNLKFESKPVGAAKARGGKAQVKAVEALLDSNKVPGFKNRHQDYPKTYDDFMEGNPGGRSLRDYKLMFKKLKVADGVETDCRDENDFADTLGKIFLGEEPYIATSKLMQLYFLDRSERIKPKEKYTEFWTDMLFLSIKKGDRFGPFGKLY